ncbi:MAG: hypothetical protein QF511_02860, partial [Rhodospirillales bacterium]|nr:hypothetical protein [Rhodospirillales bacterium]MDP7215343.1 hypothetical protein [Rhodospirillales bacterium]
TTKWPSTRWPITKIMSSDGCKGDTVPLEMGPWYDFHEVGCHLGNVGLIVGRTRNIKLPRIRNVRFGMTKKDNSIRIVLFSQNETANTEIAAPPVFTGFLQNYIIKRDIYSRHAVLPFPPTHAPRSGFFSLYFPSASPSAIGIPPIIHDRGRRHKTLTRHFPDKFKWLLDVSSGIHSKRRGAGKNALVQEEFCNWL